MIAKSVGRGDRTISAADSFFAVLPAYSARRMLAISLVRCAARSRFCAISCVARCCSSAAAAIWCERPDRSSVWAAMLSMPAMAVETSAPIAVTLF